MALALALPLALPQNPPRPEDQAETCGEQSLAVGSSASAAQLEAAADGAEPAVDSRATTCTESSERTCLHHMHARQPAGMPQHAACQPEPAPAIMPLAMMPAVAGMACVRAHCRGSDILVDY